MRFGDLSNKPSPTVVIDIDGLVIQDYFRPKETLIRKINRNIRQSFLTQEQQAVGEVNCYKLNEGIYPILERLFYGDVGVYFFAHRPWYFKEPLEELFNPLLYNHLIVGGVKEREGLLSRRYIQLYYFRKPEHGSFLSKSKERYIEHYKEINLW